MDGTYSEAVADPVVGVTIASVEVNMGPPLACRIVLIDDLASGAQGRRMRIDLGGERAQAFLSSWTQVAARRKMLENLRDGGELPGVTPA